MRREIVVLRNNEKEKVLGLNTNTSLKEFRNQLKEKEYTEINTIYRAGHHIVEFLTVNLSRQELINAGFIKKA